LIKVAQTLVKVTMAETFTASRVEIDIDFVSREDVLKELKTSPATLRRVCALLRKFLKRDFPHDKYQKGFTTDSFEILKLYFALRGKGLPPKLIAQKIRDRLYQ